MAKGIKVTINRRAWGEQVTGSESMQKYIGKLGEQVAAKLPGGRVEVEVTGVVGGGLRARAKITTTIPMADEAENGTALAALQSVVPSGHRNTHSVGGRKWNAIRKSDKRKGSA